MPNYSTATEATGWLLSRLQYHERSERMGTHVRHSTTVEVFVLRLTTCCGQEIYERAAFQARYRLRIGI
ncbi:MAG TPA: hypothetical protein VFD63_09945 [Pyrinomonadaceae bacterium]|nr:hypothetical protein [Pyrinomonadaceae bacterium]